MSLARVFVSIYQAPGQKIWPGMSRCVCRTFFSWNAELTKEAEAYCDAKPRRLKRSRVQSNRPLLKPGTVLEERYRDIRLRDLVNCNRSYFQGNIVVIESPEEELAHLSILKGMCQETKIMGIDTESIPNFIPVNSNSNVDEMGKQPKSSAPPAVLFQLATNTQCLLYRLEPRVPIPRGLEIILNDPKIIKVGHDIRGDIRPMYQHQQLVSPVRSTVCTLKLMSALGSKKPGLK